MGFEDVKSTLQLETELKAVCNKTPTITHQDYAVRASPIIKTSWCKNCLDKQIWKKTTAQPCLALIWIPIYKQVIQQMCYLLRICPPQLDPSLLTRKVLTAAVQLLSMSQIRIYRISLTLVRKTVILCDMTLASHLWSPLPISVRWFLVSLRKCVKIACALSNSHLTTREKCI